ncbi:hypothetical protein J6500_12755 [Bradyrhizobium sp. WSM 1704]|uniref:hypothetical protein n=1 Tax=Bradyrhizobium semiaridum TaxID=2821404 RepID=UPI001CE32856|nr:hypothetical protein [Bradyrhizobium semiaridum]MCA6122759.1 hypothetical protein [Bradyrhizobium semiaridum]
MQRLAGCLLLLLLAASATAAETRFTCDPPRGKRIELGPSAKSGDAQWIDDDLDAVRPAVAIDGQTLSVTWGSSPTPESKGAKLTTYVFAAARRDATSIVATRMDEATAEIFRFYFGSKVLYKLTTRAPTAAPDGRLPSPFVATYLANCREQ